jgi:MFS family permease
MTDAAADPAGGRFTAFSYRSFTVFFLARVFTTFGAQVLSVAVLWEIYDLTKSAWYTGLVGLVQFVPLFLLVLVTGTAADRFGRRLIMGLSIWVMSACAGAMLAASLLVPAFHPAEAASAEAFFAAHIMLAILVMFGVGRAFLGPASSSLVVSLVPPSVFANAVTWNSSAWQAATIIGPAAGGLLLTVGDPAAADWMRGNGMEAIAGVVEHRGAEVAYTVALVMMAVGGLLIFTLPKPPKGPAKERPTLSNLFEGFRYIWRQKIVLGAISLDLFAVLMGGVVALMPIYADEILHLGPAGVGWLRAAPGIGAVATAGLLAAFPIRDHAGAIMFVCVGLFGAFTVLFGFSTIPLLSIIALILLGAADMVSVVVRETLLQLWTPDDVRGRVNAVNGVFVSASNEMGEFRAGSMARAIGEGAAGAVPAAVIGGFGAVAVAVIWAWMFPQLRKARHLNSGVDAAGEAPKAAE